MAGLRDEGNPFREWLDVAWSVVRNAESGPADAPPLPGAQLQEPRSTSLLVTLRAITADRPTRNFTLYPLKELRGDGESTGYVSFVRPYGVPVMLHHIVSPTGLVPDTRILPVGRVLRARLVRGEDGEHFVELTARITDPWAVDAIQRGLLHTVSIGHVPRRVACSICGSEMPDDVECSNGHRRGLTYTVQQEGSAPQVQTCYSVMQGIQAVEVSFVNVPSDRKAMIRDVKPEPAVGEAYSVPSSVGFQEGGAIPLDEREALGAVVREESADVVAEAIAAAEPTGEEGVGQTADERRAPGEEQLEEDEDRVCSAEELWFVSDEDLPDWAQEAKLTAAQRRKLPDSAFCGPDRSFPAHDKAHVLAGLRLLGRAKLSPAQKARVRACLLRRARRFGLPAGQQADKECLLLLVHPFDSETVHSLVLYSKEALEAARNSAIELMGDDGSVEYTHSVSFPATLAVVPRTLAAYESLVELLLPGGSATSDDAGSADQEAGSEPPAGWREQVAQLLGVEQVEDADQLVQSISDRFQELSAELEHYRAQVDELEQERIALRAELEQAQMALQEWRHRTLVDEAARLAIAAGYPPARRRTFDQLREMFSSRSDEMLESLIADLRESGSIPTPDDVEVPIPTESAGSGSELPAEQSEPAFSTETGSSDDERLMKIIELLVSSQSRPEEEEETERFLIPNLPGGWSKYFR